MRIATFNVNSVKARLGALTRWLEETAPDIVCLQEIKCVADAFPREDIEALGYNLALHGQKTYNGVALLSKFPLEDVLEGLPDDDSDEQARYVEATAVADGVAFRVASIYLPNGNPLGSEKFPYKLGWMDRLIARAEDLLQTEEPIVLAGDYNVIPRALDAYNADAWRDDALFQPESRARYRRIANLGFTDAIRACHGERQKFSFWDYQAGAWPKDNGIRIDHLMLSPQAADRLTGADVDRNVRGRDKPSDHAPVWADFSVS